MSKGSRDRTKDRDKFDVNFEKIFSKKKGNKERKKQMSHNNTKPDCAHPPCEALVLCDLGVCAPVQLHMPAHTHTHP